MRIAPDWLARPEAQAVCAVLERAGHRALFVGGCVRNTLLGAPVSDMDLSSDARPERVMALMRAEGLKVVPTGIDHGTVTVVAGGVPFEITTFRRDVETFGRHATVAFAEAVEEDAERRDFTMNAIYCDARGEIVDPVGGVPDALARRLRFVGVASERVTEDYLRILRFFRFHAWYADSAQGLDPDGLDACARHAERLAQISAERIGAEMKKLLAAPDPAPEVAAMQATGVLRVVLPGADSTGLAPLVHLEQKSGRAPDPLARLATLGGEDPAERLRLSRVQARRQEAIRTGALEGAPPAELGYRLGRQDGGAAVLVRAALTGALPPDALAEAERGAVSRFPVTASDLMPALQGAALGRRLKQLERRWLDSGLRLSREALLD